MIGSLGLLQLAPALHAQAPSGHEIPPVFQAAEVLKPGQLAGPHHRVRASAPSDGYLTHFTVDSDFGTFTCVGVRELETRLREIDAIARLVAVSKSDLFAQGLQRSVEAPVDAVKNIVEDPAESLRKAPSTVGHFFRKVGSSVGNTARRVGDRIEGGGGSAADAGRGIGNAAKSAAGFDQAKLDCARQLGVDPYSDNARLQEEMEKVTWAFFAGGLPLRVGAAAVSGGASMALTATKTVGLPGEIYDVTPAEMALRDRNALVEMGAGEELINRVLDNPVLTVSLRHGIVAALARLPGGDGRLRMVEVAAGLDKRGQAVFLLQSLNMLGHRHANRPYASMSPYGRLPAAITADGGLEVAAPVDFVSWTAQIDEFANRGDLGEVRKVLVLGGGVSKAAEAGFRRAGWMVIAAP